MKKKSMKQRSFISTKPKKSIYFNLNILLKLFRMFGIDVCTFSAHVEKEKMLMHVTRNLWKFSLIFQVITLIVFTFFTVASEKDIKRIFVLLGLAINVIMIWVYVYKFQTKNQKALLKLINVGRMLEISPPHKLMSVFTFLFTFACFMTALIRIYTRHESISYRIFRDITFDLINLNSTDWRAKALIEFFSVLYQLTFSHFLVFIWYFTAFYIIICRCIVLLLSKHIDLNKRILTYCAIKPGHYDSCLLRYDSIIKIFSEVNSNLSFPVFSLITYNALGILYGVTSMIKNDISIQQLLFSISNFTIFTGITIFASAVNEADKKAKTSNVNVVKRLILYDNYHVKTKMENLKQEFYTPPFVLTGWIFFEFTGNLYLTATGSIMTYSLLLANM